LVGHWNKILTVSVIFAILIFGGIPFAYADPPADFGDAPDGGPTGYPIGLEQIGAFPSLNVNNGAHAHDTSLVSLGPTNSAESDAQLTNLDDSDNGPVNMSIILSSIPPTTFLVVESTSSVTATYFLNVLIDLNQDGVWGGVGAGGELEHVVNDQEVELVPGVNSITTTDFAFGSGNILPFPSWMRITLTSTPVGLANWDGTGGFAAGEVEDYVIENPFKAASGPLPVPTISCPPFKKGAGPFFCNVTNGGATGNVKWTMNRVDGGVTITSPAANIASTPTSLFGTIVALAPTPGGPVPLGPFNPVVDPAKTPSLWRVTIAPEDPVANIGVQVMVPQEGTGKSEFEFTTTDVDTDGDLTTDTADPITTVPTDGFETGDTVGVIDSDDNNPNITISPSISGGITINTPTGGTFDQSFFDLCARLLTLHTADTVVEYKCLPNGTGWTLDVTAGLATATLTLSDGTVAFSELFEAFPAPTSISYDALNDQITNTGSFTRSVDCSEGTVALLPGVPTSVGPCDPYLTSATINSAIDDGIVDTGNIDCFDAGSLRGCIDTPPPDPIFIVPGFLLPSLQPNTAFIHTFCNNVTCGSDPRNFLDFGPFADLLFLDISPDSEVEVGHANTGTLGTYTVFYSLGIGILHYEALTGEGYAFAGHMTRGQQLAFDLDNSFVTMSSNSPGIARVFASGPSSDVVELTRGQSHTGLVPSDGTTTTFSGTGNISDLSKWSNGLPNKFSTTTIQSGTATLDGPLNVRAPQSLDVASGATLIIDPDQTLTIESLGVGNNAGTIINNGNLVIVGTFNNNAGGVIQNNGIININAIGTLENSGTISNNGAGEINIGGTLNNNCGGIFTNNGGALTGSVTDNSVPSSGDWTITTATGTCILQGNVVAPANVIVEPGATLVIPIGITLDINFAVNNLTVQAGGGVLVEAGGTIT